MRISLFVVKTALPVRLIVRLLLFLLVRGVVTLLVGRRSSALQVLEMAFG